MFHTRDAARGHAACKALPLSRAAVFCRVRRKARQAPTGLPGVPHACPIRVPCMSGGFSPLTLSVWLMQLGIAALGEGARDRPIYGVTGFPGSQRHGRSSTLTSCRVCQRGADDLRRLRVDINERAGYSAETSEEPVARPKAGVYSLMPQCAASAVRFIAASGRKNRWGLSRRPSSKGS